MFIVKTTLKICLIVTNTSEASYYLFIAKNYFDIFKISVDYSGKLIDNFLATLFIRF